MGKTFRVRANCRAFLMRSITFFFAVLMVALPAAAQQVVRGPVDRIADGDTLTVAGQTIRLWGIDAPELHQDCTRDGSSYPCGEVARSVLAGLIGDSPLACTVRDRDRYRRVVAVCATNNGAVVNRMMVRAGWAVDYAEFSRRAYAADEMDARRSRRGLWGGGFQTPAEWRRGRR